MLGMKEGTGDPSSQAHHSKRWLHLFYEIGFYTGFPLEIRFCCQKFCLKTNLVQTFHILDTERVRTFYLLKDKEIKVQEK